MIRGRIGQLDEPMKDPKEALRKVHSLQEVETTLLSVQDALNNVRDQLFELRVYAVEDFAPPPEARRPATAERPEPQKKVTN